MRRRTVFKDFYDHYTNLKLIGEGGFAKVYRATKNHDKEYAVKSISKRALEKKNESKSVLLNEIKLLREVDHECVIKLFEAVSYTHLRAHETRHDLVCRLLLEKKKAREISSQLSRY
eukprot:TRINITY_DN16491_c0_g1_i1.p3 TRINITY_DN16491_c0_g1~~TRINITY_DN16491_c0_g1_i1.p3  ORF type:complete len:117 (-),score=24.30 TRINITY_DN16491_c0_g1_i1:12-362(-)